MIGDRTYRTHEMPSQDRWASFRAAWAQIKIHLEYQFTYPHELFTDLLQMLLMMLVESQVWIALYAGRDVHVGATLAQGTPFGLM